MDYVNRKSIWRNQTSVFRIVIATNKSKWKVLNQKLLQMANNSNIQNRLYYVR